MTAFAGQLERRAYLVGVAACAALVVAVCLACQPLTLAARAGLPQLVPSRHVVEACVAVRTIGRTQFGVGWVSAASAYSNAMPPPFYWTRDHPNLACAVVPWPSSLPKHGNVVFPR